MGRPLTTQILRPGISLPIPVDSFEMAGRFIGPARAFTRRPGRLVAGGEGDVHAFFGQLFPHPLEMLIA
jgi:hypothetical protein